VQVGRHSYHVEAAGARFDASGEETAHLHSVTSSCYKLEGVSSVGFILKPSFRHDKSEAGVILDDLVPWLRSEGHVPVVTTEDQVGPDGAEIIPEDELGSRVDLAVVLGGDGTMLRAAQLVADQGRPVLGINLGQLGFLTGFAPEEARAAITAALAGELAVS
jgi:NAD+ kinase